MSEGTETPDRPALVDLVMHVLVCTRVSLRRARRDLREESRPDKPDSPQKQADLLDAPFRRLRRGVDLLKHGRCRNERLLGVLLSLADFYETMNDRICREVREAAPGGGWVEAGRMIVLESRRELRRLQKQLRQSENRCGRCERC